MRQKAGIRQRHQRVGHVRLVIEDVEAGGSVSFSFPASIDGAFEIELENAKEQIAELTVEP